MEGFLFNLIFRTEGWEYACILSYGLQIVRRGNLSAVVCGPFCLFFYSLKYRNARWSHKIL